MDHITGRVKACLPSATVKLMAKGIEMRRQGLDIQVLSGGEPDFDTPEKIKEAGIRAIKENHTHYTPSPGLPELRRAVAEKLWRENRIKADPENEILITPSCKTALFQAALAFLEPGDEAMLLEPNWISYRAMVQLAGAKCISVPLRMEDHFTITRDVLEQHATEKTKVLILSSPCNPTGRVMTAKEADDVASFITERDILLFSDELYERLVFDGRKNISLMARRELRDRVITFNGFSKGYAMTGWRLGYSAANPELTRAMLTLQDHISSCACSISQYAALPAFGCESDVKSMVAEFQRRRDAIYEGMREIPCVTCCRSEGSFYLFCRVNYRGMDSLELCDHLLEHSGTLVAPGDIYGGDCERTIRLSFAASMDTIRRGVERIQRALSDP